MSNLGSHGFETTFGALRMLAVATIAPAIHAESASKTTSARAMELSVGQ